MKIITFTYFFASNDTLYNLLYPNLGDEEPKEACVLGVSGYIDLIRPNECYSTTLRFFFFFCVL
mgnify:CR=1 FL=1